jgi:hypothetical protein
MRASSASCMAEVVWHECIKLCSGDAFYAHWVAGHLFVGIVSLLSYLLMYCFLLQGGLQMASKMS